MRAESVEGVGFGQVLRRYRVAAGLTQEALAERAGLSARGISDLERAARTRPYPATVRRLAKALGLAEVDQQLLEMAAESAVPLDAANSSSFVGPAGMLAAPLSSFVGREDEIARGSALACLGTPGYVARAGWHRHDSPGAGGRNRDGRMPDGRPFARLSTPPRRAETGGLSARLRGV